MPERTKEITLDLRDIFTIDDQQTIYLESYLKASSIQAEILRLLSEEGFTGGTLDGTSINLIYIRRYTTEEVFKDYTDWVNKLKNVLEKIINLLKKQQIKDLETREINLDELVKDIVLIRLDWDTDFNELDLSELSGIMKRYLI